MSEFSRWIFDFETPKDWDPATPWCWINCPISILAPLGKPCPGMNPHLDVCPIRKRAERIKSLAEIYESENKNSIEDKIENVEKIIWYATHLKEELEEMKGESDR